MRTLKIESLPNARQWVDRDELMLHACFQILQDCVELEEVEKHVNYEAHKDFVDECRFLYEWWQTRKILSPTDEDEDTKMLIRLMNIREMLWV